MNLITLENRRTHSTGGGMTTDTTRTTAGISCRSQSCKVRRGFKKIPALLLLLAAANASGDSDPSLLYQNREGSSPASPFRIVVDAGSTGSRLHIFELVKTSIPKNIALTDKSDSSKNVSLESNTRIECLRRGSSKAWTPLSAFAREKGDIHNMLNSTHVAHHMLPLFEYASIIIPSEYHSTTHVRIAATAGMRLLSAEEQRRVYEALYQGLMEQTESGRFTFTALSSDDIMTLDGEREGFFGAVAANYLRGVIDAELRVIVPTEDEVAESSAPMHEIISNKSDDVKMSGTGLCTNKFGMCEQDAEDIVFGPSHHYVPHQKHDVRTHGPLGALDMGGSSTQIVYRKSVMDNTLLHSNDYGLSGTETNAKHTLGKAYDIPTHLRDEEFFSTSYLSYGADQFRERLWDLWVSESSKQNNNHTKYDIPEILNPCSFVGYEITYKGFNLKGTGNAVECTKQINRLIPHRDNVIDLDELYDENIAMADPKVVGYPQTGTKRKMVGGVEHPPLTGKFYGMSLYFFTLDCLRELSDPDHPIHVSWPTPSIEELTHALDGFCARKWQGDLEEVQHDAHEHTRAEVLPHRCVEAVYMVTLLRDGFGFHPTSRDITFTQWVDGNEVEWSLGMALSEFAAMQRIRK
mmetsp:Transcript_8101/g.16345  ORF Transcript_8101/g.16345 Transcript_8101/m.16345 type:complete len:635 (-) Transcript_8101:25-1929(-)